jgi:hypothetical protein
MDVLVFWIFMSYGMTCILVWGSIFENQRNWIKSKSIFFGDLISCTLCTSTWVGFFLSLCLGGLSTTYFDTHWIPSIFFDGMFTAGSVWALNAIIEFFENK